MLRVQIEKETVFEHRVARVARTAAEVSVYARVNPGHKLRIVKALQHTGGRRIDAANLLKPALARGQLRLIGATTLDDYREGIERDPALEQSCESSSSNRS